MKKASNLITWVIILALLVLNWTALDDITTGHEPSYWEEWDTVVFSLIILGVLSYANRDSLRNWIKNKTNQ